MHYKKLILLFLLLLLPSGMALALDGTNDVWQYVEQPTELRQRPPEPDEAVQTATFVTPIDSSLQNLTPYDANQPDASQPGSTNQPSSTNPAYGDYPSQRDPYSPQPTSPTGPGNIATSTIPPGSLGSPGGESNFGVAGSSYGPTLPGAGGVSNIPPYTGNNANSDVLNGGSSYPPTTPPSVPGTSATTNLPGSAGSGSQNPGQPENEFDTDLSNADLSNNENRDPDSNDNSSALTAPFWILLLVTIGSTLYLVHSMLDYRRQFRESMVHIEDLERQLEQR